MPLDGDFITYITTYNIIYIYIYSVFHRGGSYISSGGVDRRNSDPNSKRRHIYLWRTRRKQFKDRTLVPAIYRDFTTVCCKRRPLFTATAEVLPYKRIKYNSIYIHTHSFATVLIIIYNFFLYFIALLVYLFTTTCRVENNVNIIMSSK